MLPFTPCPVCACDRFDTLYPVRDTNQGVQGTWQIIACLNCGLGRLDPLPATRELSDFYGPAFYTSDGSRYSPATQRLRTLLVRLRVRQVFELCPEPPAPGRALDFGAGAGHFGRELTARGFEVAEEDIAYGSTGRLRMHGDTPHLDYPDDYFDLATMWHVLEHMRSPAAVLREIYRVLAPGAVLITAQPNFSSIQARHFGPDWLHLDPPRHLYHFTPYALRQLAKANGFMPGKTSHRSLEMGVFGILQSGLNHYLGNENCLFRCLKNHRLELNNAPSATKKLMNLALAALGTPAALAAYNLLAARGSGDAFAMALIKPAT